MHVNELVPNYYTTEEVANFARVKPPSVRRGLCIKGHFWGVTPWKAPNGRLMWPRAEMDRVLGIDRETGRDNHRGDL